MTYNESTILFHIFSKKKKIVKSWFYYRQINNFIEYKMQEKNILDQRGCIKGEEGMTRKEKERIRLG